MVGLNGALENQLDGTGVPERDICVFGLPRFLRIESPRISMLVSVVDQPVEDAIGHCRVAKNGRDYRRVSDSGTMSPSSASNGPMPPSYLRQRSSEVRNKGCRT